MNRYYLTLLGTILLNHAYAQTIVVNADGTHAHVVGTGAVKTIVNANGTHSLLVGEGPVRTLVQPDGSHSIHIDHTNPAATAYPKILLWRQQKTTWKSHNKRKLKSIQ